MVFNLLILMCVMGLYLFYKDVLDIYIYAQEARKSLERFRNKIELFIVKRNKTRVDKELFNSSIILKNISLVNKEAPFSADYMYEKLMDNSIVLKPIYSQMLTLYRGRKNADAFKILPLTIGTKNSKQFSVILAKLEKLNPAELEKQIEVFQKSMMENRMTYSIKRVQRNSLILTVLSTITIFALLLNFVVVVVFLSTIETLNELFI